MTKQKEDLKSLFEDAFADTAHVDDAFTQNVQGRVKRRRSRRILVCIGALCLGLIGIYSVQIEGLTPQPNLAGIDSGYAPDTTQLEINFFEDADTLDELEWPAEYGALAMMINDELE